VIEDGATKKLINKKVHKTKILTEKFLESKPVPTQPAPPAGQRRQPFGRTRATEEDWTAEERLCEDDTLPGFSGIGKILPHIKEEQETLGLESPLNSHSSHRWNRDSFRPPRTDVAGEKKPYDADIFFPRSQDLHLNFKPTLIIKPQAEVEQLIDLHPKQPPTPPARPSPAAPQQEQPPPCSESPGLPRTRALAQQAKHQSRSKSNSLAKKHMHHCLADLDFPRPADSSHSPLLKSSPPLMRSFEKPKRLSRTPGKPVPGSFASRDRAGQPGAPRPFLKREQPTFVSRDASKDRRFPLQLGKAAQSYVKGAKKLSVLQSMPRKQRREPLASEDFNHLGVETVSFATVEETAPPFHCTGSQDLTRSSPKRHASPLRHTIRLAPDPPRNPR